MTSSVPNIRAANERYARQFTNGNLPARPSRQVAILTCMDARLDPAKFLGLEEGDAHVIRNAGGCATEDAIRSLVISQQMLGTHEVVVIHHTDCGMLNFTNDQLRDKIRQDLGADASSIDFLPFSDLEESVRQDVETVRNSSLVSKDTTVSGFIYDVRSGRLHVVI